MTWDDVKKMRGVVGMDFPPDRVAAILDALLAARPVIAEHRKMASLLASVGYPQTSGLYADTLLSQMKLMVEAQNAYAADPRRVEEGGEHL